MQLSDLLRPECTTCTLEAGSKKRLLERASELLAEQLSGLAQGAIFDSLIGRERLGSTGLDHGVALPHGRIAGAERAVGAFIRLEEGVDFDAIDGKPVDLVFVLLVPEHFTNEHLQILSLLAEMFGDEAFCKRLRAAPDDAGLYRLLAEWGPATGATA